MSPLPNRELSPLHNNNNNGGDLTHSPNKQLDNAAIHGAISSNSAAATAGGGGATGGGEGALMKRRSVSMLEMADLEDLKEFNDAMDQLEREHNHHHHDHRHGGGEGEKDAVSNIKEMGGFLGGANNSDGGGGDNGDFLFFDDAHDEDNDDDNNGDHNLVTLVAKAAFKEHDNHNPHALLKSGGGGGGSCCNSSSGTSMRRIQSMGVMTTSTDAGGPIRRLSLLGMAPDLMGSLTKIDEDEDDSDHEKVCDRLELLENRGGEETIMMVNFGDDDDDEEDVDSSFKRQDRPQKDLDISTTSSRLSSLRNSINSSSSHHQLDNDSISSSGHALSSSRHSMQPKKSSMKKSTSQSSMKRNVSFSSLEIRSYNITVGDAPTPNGVPLSLDWEYDPSSTETYDVNDYESTRGTRREKDEMYVPNQYRVYLLMRDAGVSRREIKMAIEESRSSFKRRQQTVKNLKMQPVEEALEKTKRKFVKLTGRVRK